jgi:hypothetical protein
VEVRIRSWLSVSADLRYRWVPNLLGDGGVSAALGEEDFGGFHAGAGLRIGFGGPSLYAPPSTEPPSTETRDLGKLPVRVVEAQSGIILASAPVYLRPDTNLEPLRVLEAGTAVKILQENEEWIRIEFPDRFLGPRIGYVLRTYVRLPK